MNDPVMFVLGILAASVIVLMLVDHDPRMYDAPTRDEMTTVIPDVFDPANAPHNHGFHGKHVDFLRAVDQPYIRRVNA